MLSRQQAVKYGIFRRTLIAASVFAVSVVYSQQDPDSLTLGRAALADGLNRQAEHNFVKHLAINQHEPEKCIEALSWLCRAVYMQGRYEDVVRLLDSNGDVADADSSGIFDIWRVRSLIELHRFDEALQTISQAFKLNKISHINRLHLLRLQACILAQIRQPGDIEQARAVFSNANQIASESVGVEYAMFRLANLLDWANVELAAEDKEAALRLLSQQRECAVSLTNSISAEAGALLYAQLLTEIGEKSEAFGLMEKIAFSEDAYPVNRAEALLLMTALTTNSAAIIGYGEQIFKLPLKRDALAQYELRYGRALVKLQDDALIVRGARHLQHAIRENPAAPNAAQAQYELAASWLAVGSNELANAEFRNLQETYTIPQHLTVAALRGRATALSRIENYDEAASLFTKAAQNATNLSEKAQCAVMSANSLHVTAKYIRAAELYKQAAAMAFAAEDTALCAFSRFMSADSVERSGNIQAAVQEFGDLVADYGTQMFAQRALLRIAAIEERCNDFQSATISYTKVIKSAEEEQIVAHAYLGRGRARYSNYNFKGAIEDFAQIPTNLVEEAGEGAYLTILAHYGLGRDNDAAELAKRFIEERKESKFLPRARLWLAQYHFNRKAFSEAERAFLDFTVAHPHDFSAPSAVFWAAQSAFMQAEYQRAIDTVARGVRDYPQSDVAPDARFLQAKALCSMTRFEDAVVVLDELILRFPADDLVTDALILKADALFSASGAAASGQGYAMAISAYQDAIARTDVTPDKVIACSFQIARCYEIQGHAEEALAVYYEKIINRFLSEWSNGTIFSRQTAAQYSKAVINAAEILEKQGNTDAALNILLHIENTNLPESEQAATAINRLRHKK